MLRKKTGEVRGLEYFAEAAGCVLLPFLGTSLGAATVFFLRREAHMALQRVLLGFSAGVMLAAMVWSLLLPAIDMTPAGVPAWVPAAVGFLLGIGGLLALDGWLHRAEKRPEKGGMLALAVTLHNLPEGMAVGVALAGMLAEETLVTAAGAAALSLGIAIQNIPEGAIISAPLAAGGLSRGRAFGRGVLSGAVEPLGALLTIGLAAVVVPVLPYLLSFAAGAMIYVVVEELIPETSGGNHSNLGTLSFAAGFTVMMALDVALG